MNILDSLLRLLGTNRVRLQWRWRQMRERWGSRGGAAAGPRVALGGLIPEEFPLASVLLLGACAVFYLLTVRLTNEASLEGGATPSPVALVRYGAIYTPLLTVGHEWWRLLTSLFLHAGVMHIVMNALGLWIIGNALEEHFGRARAVVVFVASGAVGMVASVALRPMVFVVGASGGIFGMMGCMLAHALRNRGTSSAAELRARVVPWLIYGLITGLAVPGIDNLAHLGGLAAGAVFGLFLAEKRQARRVHVVWEALAVMAVVAVAAAFVLAARSPFVPD